ncbi:MAG: nucleoside-diphosphate sugar epimerase/dehydratase [Synergistaceae bacterium]
MLEKENKIIVKMMSIFLKLASRGRYVLALDAIALAFAVYMGYALRLSFLIEPAYVTELFQTMAVFSLCVLTSLVIGKTYKTVWPRASIEEYVSFFHSYIFGVIAFLIILKLTTDFLRIPRSSISIMIFCGAIFMTASRGIWKLAFTCRKGSNGKGEQKAIIVGAGEAGVIIARDLIRYDNELEPIGFIDDKKELQGMTVASLKVLGTTKELRRIVISQNVEVVLITIPSAKGTQIKKIIDTLTGLDITVRVLPGILDMAGGKVAAEKLRSVSLEDLLRRDPIKLDTSEIEKIVKGKTVLVTGAGGSIGSEICRQVIAHNPAQLLALGHGENSIYTLLETINEAGIKIPVRPIIADIADITTMKTIFEKHKPQVIFHAGAHKHVPLMEENPREALRVNSFGTYNLALLAGEHKVERMVMISTDKAVNPTSVMGATKRLAEKLMLSVQQKYPTTAYMVVRFGNVLGSRGSVVPKFEKQIAKGGPVTVTHRDMVRYFMLIPEAVSLVLQAATMGRGGELYVLDMGEPVNITEMAETLICLHGKEPYKDIDIEFSGIRPGEKLYEELFYDNTHVDTTTHTKIFKTKLVPEEKDLEPIITTMLKESAEGIIDKAELKKEIFNHVDEIRPTEQ